MIFIKNNYVNSFKSFNYEILGQNIRTWNFSTILIIIFMTMTNIILVCTLLIYNSLIKHRTIVRFTKTGGWPPLYLEPHATM